MSDEIHIASLIIHARPGAGEGVGKSLALLPAAEVFSGESPDKLVLVFEAASSASLYDTIEHINNLDGVLAVNLVYHHHESPSSLAEEVNYVPHAT